MEISNNIIKYRKLNGITQADVAGKLSITRQAYSHYETGRRVPPLDVMEKLCSVFGIDMNTLTDGSDGDDAEIAEEEKKASDFDMSEEDFNLIKDVKYALYGDTKTGISKEDAHDVLLLVKAAKKLQDSKKKDE